MIQALFVTVPFYVLSFAAGYVMIAESGAAQLGLERRKESSDGSR